MERTTACASSVEWMEQGDTAKKGAVRCDVRSGRREDRER